MALVRRQLTFLHLNLSGRKQRVKLTEVSQIGYRCTVQCVSKQPPGAPSDECIYQRYFSAQLSSPRLYTDDTSAYASNTNISALELSLNKDLENLSSWFASNYLSVDGKKTQVMILGKHSGYGFLNILGVHIDHKLSFLDHLSTFLKKVYSKVGALRRIIN